MGDGIHAEGGIGNDKFHKRDTLIVVSVLVLATSLQPTSPKRRGLAWGFFVLCWLALGDVERRPFEGKDSLDWMCVGWETLVVCVGVLDIGIWVCGKYVYSVII